MDKFLEAFKHALVVSESDPKIPLETTGKLTEEVGELMREVLIHNGTPGTQYRSTSHEKLTEELADVFLCAISIIEKLKIDPDVLAEAMVTKAAKWQENLKLEAEGKFP